MVYLGSDMGIGDWANPQSPQKLANLFFNLLLF